MSERLTTYDKSRYPPGSPYVEKPVERIGEKKPKAEIDAIVDRLIKYDRSVYPPHSPEYAKSVAGDGGGEGEEEGDNKKRSKTEVKAIVDRLTAYDSKVYPPESSANRKPLGYGRWDHYCGPEPDRGKKLPMSKVDEIVERLRIVEKKQSKYDLKREVKKLSEAEISEIFERLQKCDFAKGPPDSRVGRIDLGFNRHAYTEAMPSGGLYESPKAPPGKVNEIIERLSKFDSTKYPPFSRGRDKK